MRVPHTITVLVVLLGATPAHAQGLSLIHI